MPLSELIVYANARDSSVNVSPYAICLNKKELFRAGARPVIYGTTLPVSAPHKIKLPRLLSEDSGIGLTEQYRFVRTELGQAGYSDWTHEREWRWSMYHSQHSESSTPGLPVWLKTPRNPFTRALVVVKTATEAEAVLDEIKLLFDAGNSTVGTYRAAVLEHTEVITLEAVMNLGGARRLL